MSRLQAEEPRLKDADSLELVLGAYSSWLRTHNELDFLRLIVNSKYRLEHVERDYGSDYYQLVLFLPHHIYDAIEPTFKEEPFLTGLRKFTIQFPDQYISSVTLAPQLVLNPNWRLESGVLEGEETYLEELPLSFERPSGDTSEIWGEPDQVRLFLSHKSSIKKLAYDLKQLLRAWRISAFVAHDDIRPVREWQDKIIEALGSMDALAALLTPDIRESEWVDQEIGFALGRRKLVIPVDLGTEPHGFIARLQSTKDRTQTVNQIAVNLIAIFLESKRFSSFLVEPTIQNLASATDESFAYLQVGLLQYIHEITETAHNLLSNASRSNEKLVKGIGTIREFLGRVKVSRKARQTFDDYDIGDLGPPLDMDDSPLSPGD